MRTFRILPLVFLFVCPFLVSAQEDIREQIIGYTDSTEIMIRNGRKLVADKTIRGDNQGAIETMNYLKNNVSEEYVIFYPAEELLISLANSNFEQFLYAAANYETLLSDKTKYVQVENITEQIHAFLSQELQLIKKDLERSNINSEGKELIQLYIRYYEGEDNYELNKSVKEFRKTYPDSEYVSFLRLIENYVTNNAMNFCMGYGHEFLTGNAGENFTSHFQSMNLELEWFINNVYFSIFFQGSVETLNTTQNMPVKKHDYIHTPEDDVFSIKYGFKLGKSWYTNKNVNLFSYVSIGNYQMKSQSSNFDITDDESESLKLTSVFSPGVGTACDIYIKHFKNKQTGQKVGQWFIRPNVGYDFFLTGKDVAKGGSLFVNLTMGIGIGN